jgi:hypothetical protein
MKQLIIFYNSSGMSATQIADKLSIPVGQVYKVLKDRGASAYRTGASNAMYNTDSYKLFREQILKRDNYKCTTCGNFGSKYNPLQVEHIKPKALFPSLIFDPSNAKVLCMKCHKKTPTFGRSKLRKYAKKIKT